MMRKVKHVHIHLHDAEPYPGLAGLKSEAQQLAQQYRRLINKAKSTAEINKVAAWDVYVNEVKAAFKNVTGDAKTPGGREFDPLSSTHKLGAYFRKRDQAVDNLRKASRLGVGVETARKELNEAEADLSRAIEKAMKDYDRQQEELKKLL